jgi:hypothetical protein
VPADRALLGLLCVASLAVACGANVVVDGAVHGSTGGSSGAGIACGNLSGEGLQGGGCETDAVCNGKKVLVQCTPSSTGATCTCEVNGNSAGSCDDSRSLPNAHVCDPTSGCCAMFFGK